MSYSLLKSFYYQNESLYEEKYQERIKDENTLHLDILIHNSPCFIVQSYDIYSLVVKIYKYDREILELQKKLPGVALEQFTRRCLIDEIVLTNNIEGVNSTRHEIDEVLNELAERDTKKRFRGLVQKYLMLQKKAFLPLGNAKDIREIYDELVLAEVIEENPRNAPDGAIFRKSSVSVQSPSQKEIHRGLYPESNIIEAVEKSLAFLNREDIELLIRIAAFHYLIGYIHPFYDGNGRLSRFISSYLLATDLDPLIGYRLSYTIKNNISKYYESFKTTNNPINRGDLTPFVISFLEIVLEAIAQLKTALQERHALLQRYTKISKGLPTTLDSQLIYVLIQSALFSEKGISTVELMHHLQKSRSALSTRIKDLEEKKLILAEKRGRNKYYKLNLNYLDQISKSNN